MIGPNGQFGWTAAFAVLALGLLFSSCKRHLDDDNPIPISARAKKGSFPEWAGRRIFSCDCVAEVTGRDGGVVTVTSAGNLCQPRECALIDVCREFGRRSGSRCRGVGLPKAVEYPLEASTCKRTEIFLCNSDQSAPARQ